MNPNENTKKWREIVEVWRASGLSKAEFCKKQKIVVSAFYYWCRKFEDGERRKASKTKPKLSPKQTPAAKEKIAFDDKPAFVEITIPKMDRLSNGPGQVFRITTSYGAVMEIPL